MALTQRCYTRSTNTGAAFSPRKTELWIPTIVIVTTFIMFVARWPDGTYPRPHEFSSLYPHILFLLDRYLEYVDSGSVEWDRTLDLTKLPPWLIQAAGDTEDAADESGTFRCLGAGCKKTAPTTGADPNDDIANNTTVTEAASQQDKDSAAGLELIEQGEVDLDDAASDLETETGARGTSLDHV